MVTQLRIPVRTHNMLGWLGSGATDFGSSYQPITAITNGGQAHVHPSSYSSHDTIELSHLCRLTHLLFMGLE
ncbi:hypothetical protein I3842_15G109100 [Carya illinoinensis]|uniref:Uncharacterized protein n=1 Tax=Carya illinoinensis TaxID=32201 RepID=A0A922ADC7_CARIL|nr:hypothetical protein I3842_15G109100 [Carya illinoinensis]